MRKDFEFCYCSTFVCLWQFINSVALADIGKTLDNLGLGVQVGLLHLGLVLGGLRPHGSGAGAGVLKTKPVFRALAPPAKRAPAPPIHEQKRSSLPPCLVRLRRLRCWSPWRSWCGSRSKQAIRKYRPL